ncbi:MAG: FAD-dependent monooxygenase [Bacteroidetes bacterium]|nr:FAD-dependent monooxygenase [Bacteroidota bacterium]
MSQKNITLIGSGLVGSLLAIYLAKRGHKVNVFERRGDMRAENISAGRSINLALSDRGWKGLEAVGIGDEIRKVAIPMYGRIIHTITGEINYQPYGKDKQAIWSVSRGGLNCELMTLAERNENVKIHFNERCSNVDIRSGKAEFENQLTQKKRFQESDHVIGTDGGFSAARLQLQLQTDRFEYSQHYLEHGYKELSIPAGKNGEFLLEKNALHIWPRGGYMLIALPNIDGSFTCTLFFPFEARQNESAGQGDHSFAALSDKKKVKAFFEKIFPDALPLMPTLEDDFFNNPTGSLVTVKCSPWNFKDKLLLIGDAAHAIVPFYGQGMNCGFEDCRVFDEMISKENDWEKLFSAFGKSRKPNSDAIADMAVENFIEMRDLVGDKKFLLRKKIEALINQKHPDKWTPQYTLVTFSPDVPYSEAQRHGIQHNAIMDKVMEIPGIEEKWDSPEVEGFILKML